MRIEMNKLALVMLIGSVLTGANAYADFNGSSVEKKFNISTGEWYEDITSYTVPDSSIFIYQRGANKYARFQVITHGFTDTAATITVNCTTRRYENEDLVIPGTVGEARTDYACSFKEISNTAQGYTRNTTEFIRVLNTAQETVMTKPNKTARNIIDVAFVVYPVNNGVDNYINSQPYDMYVQTNRIDCHNRSYEVLAGAWGYKEKVVKTLNTSTKKIPFRNNDGGKRAAYACKMIGL